MQNFAAPDEIGDRVRARRAALRLSQQVLATRAGLSIRTVANVERGQDTTIDTLRRIAEELGVSASELLGSGTP
jgi:transcriptional regulator with XRE-family HTH domain